MAIKKIDISVKVDNKQANTSMKATEKALDGIEKEAKEAGTATEGMWKQFAKGQLAADAMKKAFQALTGLVKDSVEKFKEQELAERRLQSALELTGESARVSFEELKAYASGIQQITTVGDETSLKLMQMGLSMGIAGDQLKGATEQAIGLSKAFGVDLNSSMKMVALARQGEFTMLQRYIPQLRATTDATEKAAIANDVLTKGFELAKAETDTMSGASQQLANTWGDVQEKIGGGIAEVLLPLMKDFTKFLQENGDGIVTFFKNVVEAVTDTVSVVVNVVEGVIDVMRTLSPPLEAIIQGWSELLIIFTGELDRVEQRVIESITSLAKTETQAINRTLEMKKALKLTTQELLEMQKNYTRIKDPVNRYNQMMIDIKKGRFDTDARKLSEEMSKQTDIWKKVKDPVKKVVDEMATLKEILIDLPKPAQNVATAVDLGTDALIKNTLAQGHNMEVIRQAPEVLDELAEANERAKDSFILVIDAVLTFADALGADGEAFRAVENFGDLVISALSGDIVGAVASFGNLIADAWSTIFGESDEEMERRRADALKQQDAWLKEMKKQQNAGIDAFSDFTKIGIDDAESFNAVLNITMRNFAQLARQGLSLPDIFSKLGGQFDVLETAMKDFGFESNETFKKLLSFRKFADENKVLLDSISALNSALIGMSEGGMIKTQDAFDDFQVLASKSFDKLKDAGATSDQAMLTMLPNLRELNRLSEEQGFILDDNIKAMIDQAKEKGIFEGEVDQLKVIADLLGLIVEHFTGMAQSSAQAFGAVAGGLAGGAGRAGGAEIIPLPRAGGGGLSGSPGGANVTDIRKTIDQKIAFKINVDVAGASEDAGSKLGRAIVEGIIKANRLNKLGLQTELTGTG